MSNELSSESHTDLPMVYQIKLKGHLDPQWAEWFAGLTITLERNHVR